MRLVSNLCKFSSYFTLKTGKHRLLPRLQLSLLSSVKFTSIPKKSPRERYDSLISSGKIKTDENQIIVVNELESLYKQIQNYKIIELPDEVDDEIPIGSFETIATKDNESTKSGFFSKLFGSTNNNTNNNSNIESDEITNIKTYKNMIVPNGLYIYGSTGTGKTMLMDLFYESIDGNIINKSRVHFNKFMLDIHDSNHKLRENLKNKGLNPKETQQVDFIPQIALNICKKSRILCFDEFQVTDIVDAVLLNRLFTCLFYYGIICIITSNRHPSLLYLNGLQRKQIFEPFLKLIDKKLDYIDLNSIDYRDTGTHLKNTYFYPLNDINIVEKFENSWNRLKLNNDNLDELSVYIDVMQGRKLLCPRVLGNSTACRFEFNELCSTNLGSADYHSLSKNFSTIFISNIPYFNLENRNELKRFILLIDELYNSKCRLVCLAIDKCELLLDLKSKYNNTNINKNEINNFEDTKNMSNTFEEIFQFDRCISRLLEMQSKEYLDAWLLLWRADETNFVD